MGKAKDIHQPLVRRLQQGDENAAKELYRLYATAMYNTLLHMVGTEEEAQDLLQESFVKAFRKIGGFQARSTFGSWLKRIVINSALEYLRKKKIEMEPLDEGHDLIAPQESEQEFELDVFQVHEAIKSLPDGSRTVLTLYLLEGFSHQEIAAELNISVSTSKTQLMRGKHQLKKKLLKTA
jgi:RNA polymerase sigma-70 factor (ECF subfamily)